MKTLARPTLPKILGTPRSLKYRILLNTCWLSLGAATIWLDWFLGVNIRFPILLMFPVAMASWLSGLKSALFFSVAFPVARSVLESSLPNSLRLYVGINGCIDIFALCALSILVHFLYRQAEELRVLRGLLPICSFCKKIRTDETKWVLLEEYITARSEVKFTHGICPECASIHFAGTLPKQN